MKRTKQRIKRRTIPIPTIIIGIARRQLRAGELVSLDDICIKGVFTIKKKGAS